MGSDGKIFNTAPSALLEEPLSPLPLTSLTVCTTNNIQDPYLNHFSTNITILINAYIHLADATILLITFTFTLSVKTTGKYISRLKTMASV